MDYKSENVILAEFTKEYIVEKRLFPYIPFYVARYEKEIAYGGRIEEAVKGLKYFRNEMLRLHKAGELSDDEIIDLMGFVNIIITHITNGNEIYHESDSPQAENFVKQNLPVGLVESKRTNATYYLEELS